MNEKQCQILEAAFKVFARFGLKKTSIDDIAKAADISRQGVYLHFKNKDEIFKASLEMFLRERSEAALSALASPDNLEERLLAALFEWFGRNIGLIHQDAVDVLEVGMLIGKPLYEDFSKAFKAALAKAIQKEEKSGKKSSEEVAAILIACGMTWKHELGSQDEFKTQMRSAIRLLLTALRVKGA